MPTRDGLKVLCQHGTGDHQGDDRDTAEYRLNTLLRLCYECPHCDE
jgi:hypothetical protein